MTVESAASSPAPQPRRRRRWLAAAGIVLGLVVFHAPLLRGIWMFPVLDDPIVGRCDAMLNHSDIDALRTVAALYAQGRIDRVWIFSSKPRLTDELGLTPSRLIETQRELAARGVPESIVAEMISGLSMSERARACANYLRQHPERNVVVATPRLLGRYMRFEFNAVLSPEEAARVRYASLPPQSFDERQWWRHRLAIQMVFQAYLQLLLTGATDLPRAIDAPIDWQAFEAAIARGEKP